MSKKIDLEEQLLQNADFDNFEQCLEAKIDAEIELARKETERKANIDNYTKIITDIKQIPFGKKFDKDTIYRVFNRKQKTETFVNGEQAENMIRYTNDYVIKFDHRIEVDC